MLTVLTLCNNRGKTEDYPEGCPYWTHCARKRDPDQEHWLSSMPSQYYPGGIGCSGYAPCEATAFRPDHTFIPKAGDPALPASGWHVRPWTTSALSCVLAQELEGDDVSPLDVARWHFKLRKGYARSVLEHHSRAEMQQVYREMRNVWRAFHTGKAWMR